MVKVALRAYNREIEALIDQGHTEEAVAHCMHILKNFPKHLETYRLMGKAYLEAHRYTEAADIFLRVLLAVPDDFVSQLGMSIVNDEKRDLNMAIWHMERAFEINSTNGGIQSELRRLYGRRDGLEPERINLTRGALAQIYMKAGEYQRAITEIKSVLSEDNSRTDMKTLLARAYFRADMKNEAIESCVELLKLYPYSLDGNRILVELLPDTSAQSLDQYQRRIRSLDPYASGANSPAFDTQSVPENTIMLERLDWQPGQSHQVGTNTQANSAASAEGIPDWMQQSGWAASSGEPQPEINQFDEPEQPGAASNELAAAEIPSWLKAMAPATVAPESGAASQPGEEEADFDWLDGLGTPATQIADQESALAPTENIPTQIFSPEIPTGDNLDWLDNSGPALNAGQAAADDNLAWLNDLTPAEEARTGIEHPAATLPDWLSEPEKPLTSSNPPAGDTPDWLDNLSLETQAEADALEKTPDWLKELAVEPTTSQTPPSSEPVSTLTTETIPSLPQEMDVWPVVAENLETPQTSPSEPAAIEDTPDWMQGLAAEVPAPSTASDSPSADESADWLNQFMSPDVENATQPETENDWLGSLEQPTYSLEATPDEPIHEEDSSGSSLDRIGDIPEFSAQTNPVSSPPAPALGEADQEEAFKWLEMLMAGQITTPSESAEMAATSQPASAQTAAPDAGANNQQDQAAQWLQSLTQDQNVAAEEAPSPAADEATQPSSELFSPAIFPPC